MCSSWNNAYLPKIPIKVKEEGIQELFKETNGAIVRMYSFISNLVKELWKELECYSCKNM